MDSSRVLSLADENRLDELVALNATVHDESRDIFLRFVQLDPNTNDPSFHRYVLEEDLLVSAASLFPHDLQWHGSIIRSGEIGLVGTLEKYRKKGFCNLLMESWIETMVSEGTPLSFLWGIPIFYEKYHYYYAYPNVRTPYVSLPRSCAKDWKATGAIRDAELEDISWFRKHYRGYNRTLTGCEVRNEKHWEWYWNQTRFNNQGRWLVPEDPRGGYAFVASDPARVWEIAASSDESLRNMVLRIFDLHPDLDELGFYHHPDMPVGRWLYQWGGRVTSPEDIWKGTWGGMVRLIDPAALLDRMTGKLQRRLQESRFYKYTGTLSFESEVGDAVIDIHDGRITIEPSSGKAELHIPASVLTPILTGYRGFERFRKDLTDIPEATSDLLCVLFPRDLVFCYPLLFANEHFTNVEEGT